MSATNITAASGVEDTEYSDLVLRAILVRNEGELTEIIPGEDALLLAYIEKREAGDLTSYAELKPRITQMLRNDRATYLFEGWQEFLLTESNFEPTEEPVVEDDAFEDEDYELEEDMIEEEDLPAEDSDV